MRNKKNIQRLVSEFIKTSPRAKAQKRNAIVPAEYHMDMSKLPSDQQYIKNFIVHIDCSYMYRYYSAPTVQQHKTFLYKKSFVNPLSVGLVRKKAIQINDKSLDKKSILFELVKQLNKDKQTATRYTQTQQFLVNLSVAETRQYKKVIVYLYKWLLNQKHKFRQGSIEQELCQDTSELVIKKIYQSHQRGDGELLRNTEEQLLSIENLEKARQMKRNAMFSNAKDTYEAVYFARLTDEVDRLEALQFICDRCKTQKDYKYLQKMIQKIKEGLGIRAHHKILNRVINQINDLISLQSQLSIQLIINPLNKTLDKQVNLSQEVVGMGQVVLDNTNIENQRQNSVEKREKQNKNSLKGFDNDKNN